MMNERKLFSLSTTILLLILIGGFQFIAFDFNWSIYLTFNYWFMLCYRLVIKIMCDIIGLNYMFEKHYNSDDVKESRDGYNKRNGFRGRDFEDYLIYCNTETKKSYYLNNLVNKQTKYLSKMNSRNGDKYAEKLKDVREKIEESQREDFDISLINVKYPKVYLHNFFVDDSVDIDSEHKYSANFNKATAKYTRNNLFKYLLIAVITGSCIFNMLLPNDSIWFVNMIFDLLLIITTIFTAIINSKRIFNNEYKVSYDIKSNLLDNYFLWSGTNVGDMFNKQLVLEKENERLKAVVQNEIDKIS